jgi:Tol biopolymer transport system component
VKASLSFLLPAGALLVVSCGQGALPQSPLLKSLEPHSGRIAYIALDGNVHTMDQGGGGQKDVTSDAVVDDSGNGTSFFYQFPAWSPDGKSLAFVGLHHDAQGSRDVGVWTAVAGASPVQVYKSPDHVPRYLSWSPDSSRLVFAAGPGNALQELDTVPARGGNVRVMESGTGFAWRWENGGARLAVHSVDAQDQADAERVRILDSLGVAEDRQLALQPGDFQAPAWAPDGRGLIMAVSDAVGSTLYLADSGGGLGTALAHVDGKATLDLSPDGRRLAWAARTAGGDPASRSLYVLDLAGRPKESGGPVPSSPSPVSGSDYVAAFSWSPDGSKIAYFVPSETDLSLTLKVLTVKTRALRTVATFIPTAYFLGMLVEFGQYAESVRLWSPDGKFLLYCDAQPDTSFDIMVAYADQPIAPRKIADGVMATWSPR